MPQYLADIKEKEFFIMDEEARHLIQAARCQIGDEITVFDGKGLQYNARLDVTQKNFARGTLLSPITPRRPALQLELCFAPNSRSGLEEVLDKGTQLGVSSFLPIVSARTEYHLLDKWESKAERWNQILVCACKQSGAAWVPQLKEPVKFISALQERQNSLLAYEAEETHSLLWGMEQLENPTDLRVFVGPAGGWTDEEVVIAAQYGTLPVTLGLHILRAETACVAVAAKLL